MPGDIVSVDLIHVALRRLQPSVHVLEVLLYGVQPLPRSHGFGAGARRARRDSVRGGER